MMMYELSQRFRFEAAHTLEREVETESSRRIHGHTYHAEVTLRGVPDPATGMVMDLGLLRRALEGVQQRLDHHLLNEVEGLDRPTLEGLCAFIAAQLKGPLPMLASVRLWRASGPAHPPVSTRTAAGVRPLGVKRRPRSATPLAPRQRVRPRGARCAPPAAKPAQ